MKGNDKYSSAKIMMQVPNKELRIGRREGEERISMALNIGRGEFVTYLSLQYNKVLLGTVIWFSHMALELGQLYVEEKTGVWNTNDGNRHVREIIPAGYRDKSFGSITYQKFKKLAMSNSVSSEDVDGLLAPLCPEPNLEIMTLAPDVPRRCKAGRVDLDLET